MKLNWGYKILLVYAVFVIGIMFLVFKSTRQKYDLVQDDYYAKELKYQNVIDASKRAKNLGGDLNTIRKGGHLIIALPKAFNNLIATGTAHLYYAADQNKDISKAFSTSNGSFEMELLTMMSGVYTLKLDVVMNGEQYYYEQKLTF